MNVSELLSLFNKEYGDNTTKDKPVEQVESTKNNNIIQAPQHIPEQTNGFSHNSKIKVLKLSTLPGGDNGTIRLKSLTIPSPTSILENKTKEDQLSLTNKLTRKYIQQFSNASM